MGVGGNATAEWRAALGEALPGCTIDDDGTPHAPPTHHSASHLRARIPHVPFATPYISRSPRTPYPATAGTPFASYNTTDASLSVALRCDAPQGWPSLVCSLRHAAAAHADDVAARARGAPWIDRWCGPSVGGDSAGALQRALASTRLAVEVVAPPGEGGGGASALRCERCDGSVCRDP